MLKIISGSKRNTVLDLPGTVTRPTMQRVRKTIFDILSDKIKNKVIIDCFAGSGAMGLEALSLGAMHAYFIETNEKVIKILNKNIEKLNFTAQATVIHADFFNPSLYKHRIEQNIDIAFIDPPYNNFNTNDIFNILEKITNNCLYVFETKSPIPLDKNIIEKEKKISDKYITFINNNHA